LKFPSLANPSKRLPDKLIIPSPLVADPAAVWRGRGRGKKFAANFMRGDFTIN